jgi:hypothetical protein
MNCNFNSGFFSQPASNLKQYMKEYMLLIRNQEEKHFSPEEHRQFLKACEMYIKDLKNQSKLIAAQPLVREGIILSGHDGSWKETPFNQDKEFQVGYYHILANNMDDAVAIAKRNPEFEYATESSRPSIEVRQVKMKEEISGFEYPK